MTEEEVLKRFETDVARLDGAELLDEVQVLLGRFVAYPSEAAHIAHALWIAHAHLIDAFDSTPRLAFLSPEPASGKTRALEITALLVPNAVESVNVSPAYLFRKVGSEERPTILYDEIDTVFGPRAKDNEEIRALLNAGHRQGAVVGRAVVRGTNVVTEEIPAFCAVALAGLGDLPDTILSRSVAIRMRPRGPGERVEAYRRRLHQPEADEIRGRLVDWAEEVQPHLLDQYPDMPPGIDDRDADVWEPLIAVADAVGGDWPERARVTAVTLVTESQESPPSLGVILLSDLREVFKQEKVLTTTTILMTLNSREESPWGAINRGNPLDPRGLAQRLRQYEVKSQTVRIGPMTAKGYRREQFEDGWSRYLPPPSEISVTSDTSAAAERSSGGDEARVPRCAECGDAVVGAPGEMCAACTLLVVEI